MARWLADVGVYLDDEVLLEEEDDDPEIFDTTAENGAVEKNDGGKKKAVLPPGQKRKYPAGDRLSRSERNLAITHTPTSKDGAMYVFTVYLQNDRL